MNYVSIYQSIQQEGFRVRTSNLRHFVIKITQYASVIGLCYVLFSSSSLLAKLSGSLSEDAISQRLKPVAEVSVEGAGATVAAQPTAVVGVGGPKDIYEHNCKMCHQTGVAGAPKLGNKGDWQPRIDQGLDVLLKAAWGGIRAMPPKGNCLQCNEDDIKKTIQFMIDAAK